jgi:hypothetical protein
MHRWQAGRAADRKETGGVVGLKRGARRRWKRKRKKELEGGQDGRVVIGRRILGWVGGWSGGRGSVYGRTGGASR